MNEKPIVSPPERDVEMRIAMFAYIVPGKVDRQRVRLWANGLPLGEGVLENSQVSELRVKIPRDALQNGRLALTFEFPDAVVPRDIGEGRDSRALAVGLCAFETALVPDGQSR